MLSDNRAVLASSLGKRELRRVDVLPLNRVFNLPHNVGILRGDVE